MKIKFYTLWFAALIVIAISSCSSTTSTARLYSEQSISADKVKMRTVAIIPNRMPISMQDPEFWRNYNWQLIAANFTAKGYRVIDYNTTVNLFTRSGLPLEDTKSSRDKYADFANEINAELVVIPYYGTSYNMESGFLNNTHKFLSIGSLQFYYAPKNDFLARIDFEGNFETKTTAPGAYAILGLLPTLLIDPKDPESASNIGTLTGILSLGFLLNDLSAPTNPMVNWKTAFNNGISKATNAFFDKYSPSVSNFNYEPTKLLVAPATSNYASFSIEELELLKKNAVEKKDFKKAAELKAEIDSRKK
ncbi:MAG: UvrB/UvrC motif-containing protein [Bacteroidia bacterium]|nr:UvrB/UvrC motif-containing protein [Bacteroidia bacterium]